MVTRKTHESRRCSTLSPCSGGFFMLADHNYALYNPNFNLTRTGAILTISPIQVGKHERFAMAVALEINCYLWIMTGCAGMKAVQFVQYLN